MFFLADTGGAVLPYAGSCLAVDGFSFLGGNDVRRSGKPKYGRFFSAGIGYGDSFLAVSGFSFLGGNDVSRSVKPKCGGILLAVIQCSGYFLAVGIFFYFSAVATLAEAVTKVWRCFFDGNALRR